MREERPEKRFARAQGAHPLHKVRDSPEAVVDQKSMGARPGRGERVGSRSGHGRCGAGGGGRGGTGGSRWRARRCSGRRRLRSRRPLVRVRLGRVRRREVRSDIAGMGCEPVAGPPPTVGRVPVGHKAVLMTDGVGEPGREAPHRLGGRAAPPFQVLARPPGRGPAETAALHSITADRLRAAAHADVATELRGMPYEPFTRPRISPDRPDRRGNMIEQMCNRPGGVRGVGGVRGSRRARAGRRRGRCRSRTRASCAPRSAGAVP
ncbi:hypothetical protein SUDANB6_01413 [Streptomyces sp. enrichment culture]